MLFKVWHVLSADLRNIIKMARFCFTPRFIRVKIRLETVAILYLHVWSHGIFLFQKFSWLAEKTLTGLVSHKFIILYTIDIWSFYPYLFFSFWDNPQIPRKLLLSWLTSENSLRFLFVIVHQLFLIFLVWPNLENFIEAN